MFCSRYCRCLGCFFLGGFACNLLEVEQLESDVNLTLNLGPLKPAFLSCLTKIVPSYVFQGFLFLGSDKTKKRLLGCPGYLVNEL